MIQCVKFIASVDENYSVGHDGKLLFRDKNDLRLFQEITMGHVVIMGRKTFEEIGKPLPGRTNIVVSDTLENNIEGVKIVSQNLGVELEISKAIDEKKQVFIIGGATLWNRYKIFPSEVILTHIPEDKGYCDTQFPRDLVESMHEVESKVIGIHTNGREIVQKRYERRDDTIIMSRKIMEFTRFFPIEVEKEGGVKILPSAGTFHLDYMERASVKIDISIYTKPHNVAISSYVFGFLDNGVVPVSCDVGIYEHGEVYINVVCLNKNGVDLSFSDYFCKLDIIGNYKTLVFNVDRDGK